MTALNPNNTLRYRVFYTVLGVQHDFQVRALASVSPATLGTNLNTLLTDLSPVLYAWTLDTVQFAPAGSNVFNTVTTGLEGNVYGSGTAAGLLKPQFLAFQGRSSGGHKVRLSIYGVKVEENDYRFNSGDSVDIGAAIIDLNTAVNCYLAIDGVKPLWYSYANTGFNAYWQRKQRT